MYIPIFPLGPVRIRTTMVNKELKKLTTPLKNHILDQIKRDVPSYCKRKQRWNALATGLAVTVKFQTLDCEIGWAHVAQGLRDVTGKAANSEHSLRDLLKTMKSCGLLTEVPKETVKGSATYLIAIDGVSDFLV